MESQSLVHTQPSMTTSSPNGSSSSIAHKNVVLMNSLHAFFQDPYHMDTLLKILHGESKISLRVVDWFVTNYSKKKNITYLISEDGHIIFDEDDDRIRFPYRQFVVYLDYKLQLKGYQKKQFDPFCRRQRIEFFYRPEEFVLTTVGQLNFFRWAITNNVIEYIERHLKTIETDMNTCYKAAYKKNVRIKGGMSPSYDSIHADMDPEFSSDSNQRNDSPFSTTTKDSFSSLVLSSGSDTGSGNGDMGSPIGSVSAGMRADDGSSSLTSTGSARRRRQELSTSAAKTIHKSHIKVVVSFD